MKQSHEDEKKGLHPLIVAGIAIVCAGLVVGLFMMWLRSRRRRQEETEETLIAEYKRQSDEYRRQHDEEASKASDTWNGSNWIQKMDAILTELEEKNGLPQPKTFESRIIQLEKRLGIFNASRETMTYVARVREMEEKDKKAKPSKR